MPSTRRVKGGYHYGKRRDGTRYRIYHAGKRGGGKYSKSGNYRKSRRGPTIYGSGTYRTRSGKPLRLTNQVPTMAGYRNSKHGVIITKKEYIGEVPSSQAFTLASLPINPGQSQTFPWLSQIAQNFEEWKPIAIAFMFKTTSSNAVVSTNANAALGTVMMATEYNVANPVFGNKQQMENYEGCVSTDPSRSTLHTVESAKSQNPLGVYFVRSGAVPAGSDQRFYDQGLFQIAAVGMQSNATNVGELWISYTIELKKPRLLTGQPRANDPSADHFNISNVSFSPISPFGTLTEAFLAPNRGSNLGGILSGGIVPKNNQANGGIIAVLDGNGNPTGLYGDSKANTYYFPPGVTEGMFYLGYNAWYQTEGGPSGYKPTWAAVNCQLVSILLNNAHGEESNDSSATKDAFAIFIVRVMKGNAHFTMTAASNATYSGSQAGDFFVMQLPNGTT